MFIVEWRIVRRIAGAEKSYLLGREKFDTFLQARAFIRTKLDEANLSDLCKINFMIVRAN